MVKVSVFYPNKPGSHFDADYYLSIHMPMAVKLLGSALKAATAEIGIAGGAPGEAAPFAAIASFTSESVDVFMEAFTTAAEKLQSDIPKYTDIEPVIQISNLNKFALI